MLYYFFILMIFLLPKVGVRSSSYQRGGVEEEVMVVDMVAAGVAGVEGGVAGIYLIIHIIIKIISEKCLL